MIKKILKWLLGIHSPSLGRKVKFKDLFNKNWR